MAVVETYLEQQKAAASMSRSYTEPTIRDFTEDVDISTRLKNALVRIADRDIGQSIRLEDIKEHDLFITRNIGRASLKEFVERRGEYLRQWRSFAVLPEN